MIQPHLRFKFFEKLPVGYNPQQNILGNFFDGGFNCTLAPSNYIFVRWIIAVIGKIFIKYILAFYQIFINRVDGNGQSPC